MRPIDADKLKVDYIVSSTSTNTSCYQYISKEQIDNAPTVDSVKRGRWIKMSDADGVYWACSECGEDIPRIAHYDPQFDLFPRLESIDRTNYCPNCGARMDK